MDLVAAGAQHGLPLPHPTATLIAELFPSVDTATVRRLLALFAACSVACVLFWLRPQAPPRAPRPPRGAAQLSQHGGTRGPCRRARNPRPLFLHSAPLHPP